MPAFVCEDCGTGFDVPPRVRDQYPGWTPRRCLHCRDRAEGAEPAAGPGGGAKRRGSGVDALLTTDEVLAKFTAGPEDGAFTDGGAVPNPGQGGWGAVYVASGVVIAEEHGAYPATTNNRMELTALIAAASLVPAETATTVYTDSQLARNTITEWAAGWERRGWKRKSGPVENLDLVKKAYYVYRRRPELRIEWIAAHSGYRWNEYADALANRWRLDAE